MDKYLGKRLDGRYEMRELIGVGGMAYVYKAYDAVDDRIVAVKILKDEFLNNDEFVRRFRNESKAIAILNHPNIVKVLDVGFGERLQYIVMEYIDGITLKEYLDQRKDIRWKEAVHFTVQILRALQHAHDKGIVHRDIKPQNIMLLSDGTIKVTDFGIARLTRSELKATTEGNKAIGSVHYISPEQARGEITDEKTDLYAVGIMLYEMLTGCLPFEADNAVSVAIMQMQSEAKAPRLINEDIPEGLEQITLKAMQKDTAKRYQSAAEMLSDFDEFKRNPSIKFEYTYMVDETPTRYVDAITRVRGETPEPTTKAKKEDVDSGKKKAPKKTDKTKITLIVILCSIVALLIAFFIIFFPKLFPKKKANEIIVDKFVGKMYYEEIEGAAEYQGKYEFKIVWEDANDPDVRKGEVFQQKPAAGKKVKEGSTITLKVNSGVPKSIKLDPRAEIEGQPKKNVRELLQKAGFVVKESSRNSDLVPLDHVISININKEESYPYGTEVTMVVSAGPSDREPIPFPDGIIGELFDTAKATLLDHNFEGDIVAVEANYTDDKYQQKGIVMGIMIDNVLQEKVPDEIKPDASVSLVVSNGCKDVLVELDWPKEGDGTNIKKLMDVRVIVGTGLDTDLSSKYSAYKPTASEKMVFTITKHPAGVVGEYDFEVQVKLHDDEEYITYVTLRVDPVAGTWTIQGDYQHLPGISPDMVSVPKVEGKTMSYDEIIGKLSDFTVSVVDIYTGMEVTSGNGLFVVELWHNGEPISGGTKLAPNASITVKVSASGAEVAIPSDIFSSKLTAEQITQKLSSFVVTMKDAAGNVVAVGEGLYVTEIWYNGAIVKKDAVLPVGSAIEAIVVSGMTKLPDDFNPVGLTPALVRSTLESLGFTVKEQSIASGDAEKDRVIYITTESSMTLLSGGSLIPNGATIIMYIGDGSAV